MIALWLAGCAAGPPPAAVDEPFVALPWDFAGFPRWASWEVPHGEHGVSVRVFASPVAWAGRRFPVGSLLVKLASDADGERTAHAMARRGGDFNPDGDGWEWFELDRLDAPVPLIVWRGDGPPEGEDYVLPGADPLDTGITGDCNTCHAAAEHGVFSRP